MPLTAKQQRFVDEYLVDLNATQAAIRAGYSEKTAYSIGNENLKKPEIAAAVAAAQEKLAGKLEITAEKVLRDLEDLRVLAIKDGAYGPAAKAIELHGKHIGMFVDRRETTIKDNRLVARLPEKAQTDEQWASEVAAVH